jgi:dihydropteroate synthase
MIKDLGRRPLIMGIINVTPDSFSGDGLMNDKAAADRAACMIGEGADILDIGGESSRPGASPVSAEEEIRRAVPVIAAIRKQFEGVPMAIDTVKATVAEAALDTGATIVNDISALADPAMAKLVAAHEAYIVLMHNRAGAAKHEARIGGEFEAPDYDGDIIDDVARDLAARIETARAAGIAPDKIIVDPGLGFGKTVEQNLALIGRLDELKEMLGASVLLGPSRKSFIGRILDAPVEDRLAGTAACVAVAVMRGADILRVHDVKEMAQVIQMIRAIIEAH